MLIVYRICYPTYVHVELKKMQKQFEYLSSKMMIIYTYKVKDHTRIKNENPFFL